jgi:soluble lytic murein transglycosylase
MQVVENTAKEQAIKLKIKQPELDELFEPRLNLLLGSSAFSHYWQRFEHLAVALCAYNAGPTAALRWSRENNAVDTLIEKISYKETRAYVKNVLGSAYAYDNQNKIELKLKLRAVVP